MPLEKRFRVVECGKITEVYEMFKSVNSSKYSPRGRKNEFRREDSALRAKRMVRWLSVGNSEPGTTYFFTATFADDIKEYEEALSRWKIFRRYLLREFPLCRYVAVPEVQPRSGRWHFHAVFSSLPDVTTFRFLYGLRTTHRGTRVDGWQYHFTDLWSRANGGLKVHRCNIEIARSLEGVCSYLSKYLCKDVGGVVPVGRRNYYSGGHALVRPTINLVKQYENSKSPSFQTEFNDAFGNPVTFSRYLN